MGPDSMADKQSFPLTADALFTLYPDADERKEKVDELRAYFLAPILYWQSKFVVQGCLFEHEMEVFRLARLVFPRFCASQGSLVDVKLMATIKGIDEELIPGLMEEFPAYVQAAREWTASNPQRSCFEFWRLNEERLPTWCKGFEDIVILTPTSAHAERVFSFFKMWSDMQMKMLGDQREATLLLQHNTPKLDRYFG